MKFWYVIILLVIVKLSKSKRSENNREDDSFRLPTSVIPEHYALKIQTFLEEENFKHISHVKIEIRCINPTNTITLHSHNLKIKKVKLIDKKGGKMTIKKIEMEQEYDFLHIYLNDYLVEDNLYRLEIDFTGDITPGMSGYYRSSYRDNSGQNKWIATTQFEPTNARRAFPCFDEPALRARFSIVLGHRPHLKAISNMPIKSSKKEIMSKNWDEDKWNDKSVDNEKNMDDKEDKWDDEEDKRDGKKVKWDDKENELRDKEDKCDDKEDKWHDMEAKWNDIEDTWDDISKKWNEMNDTRVYKASKWNDTLDKWNNMKNKWNDMKKKWDDMKNKWNDKEDKWNDMQDRWKHMEDKRNDMEEKWNYVVEVGKNVTNLADTLKQKWNNSNWKDILKNKWKNKGGNWGSLWKPNSKNRKDKISVEDENCKFESNRKKVEGRVKNLRPLKSTENNEELWQWDTFYETLNMPTYLVAYSLNDFGFKSTQKSNRYGNTTINVWAQQRILKQVKFATYIAPKILSFFEEYFDIAYPLSKTALLAVPDFYAAAMENWGLIIFRESQLLYEPGVSTEHDKHDIVKAVARGLSHYWFGNLVTIKWWSYLWLKEAFATYLARVAERHLFPKLNIFTTDVRISDMQAVYEVDALESSRPVSVHIRDPRRIYEIYDSITNFKGSCVIRMMESIVGKDVLRKGLSQYLDKYKYNSAEPDNLWNAITKVAHEHKSLSAKLSIKRIMDTWTLQAGFPLVTVDRDYSSGTVTVTQKRFLENTRKHDESCYWVPLTYTTKEARNFNSTKLKKWLSCPKKDITFELDNSDSWILFNIQASGIYRVNYDERNWKMLTKQLATNHEMIGTLNRVLLIDDVMELAMVGYVDFSIAFDLVKYVRNDDQFATWSRALGKLMEISNLLDHTSNYELIQTFISNLVIPKFKSFGRLNNLEDISKFQLEIIKVACQIGNKICEQETASMFSQWKRSSGSYNIPKEIREIVYCQGMKNGQRADWDYLWEYYKKSNIPTEKEMILGALGCTENHNLLHRYLILLIKEDSGIRLQDLGKVFTSVVENKAAYIARVFFYEKVKLIYEIETPKGASMGQLLTIVTKSLRTESDFNEYKDFLKENEQYLRMAHFAKTQTLETLVVRKNWYDNIYPKLVHALKEQIANSERNGGDNLEEQEPGQVHKRLVRTNY